MVKIPTLNISLLFFASGCSTITNRNRNLYIFSIIWIFQIPDFKQYLGQILSCPNKPNINEKLIYAAFWVMHKS